MDDRVYVLALRFMDSASRAVLEHAGEKSDLVRSIGNTASYLSTIAEYPVFQDDSEIVVQAIDKMAGDFLEHASPRARKIVTAGYHVHLIDQASLQRENLPNLQKIYTPESNIS